MEPVENSGLSIGVQTFDSRLLTRSRGHTREVVLNALRIVLELVDNVNIDLIQDLPGQTEEHILDDLDQVEQFKPAQVTWYLLRLRPEAGWFSRYRRSALDLSSSLESLRRRLLIEEGMRRIGYVVEPGGRFVRTPTIHDRFKDIRASLQPTLLGVGVSAYSHGWGFMFRNIYSRDNIDGISLYIDGISSYTEHIQKTGFAVETGYRIDEVERTASELVFGIRTGVTLPRPTLENAAYLAEAKVLLSTLERAGLVAAGSQGRYSLTNLGRLLEEEVCSLFYSPSVKRRLVERESYWRDSGRIRVTSSVKEKPLYHFI